VHPVEVQHQAVGLERADQPLGPLDPVAAQLGDREAGQPQRRPLRSQLVGDQPEPVLGREPRHGPVVAGQQQRRGELGAEQPRAQRDLGEVGAGEGAVSETEPLEPRLALAPQRRAGATEFDDRVHG
jgi:hypothetical protein